jgi:hypothetical protein
MKKFLPSLVIALLFTATGAFADTLTFTGQTANGVNGPYGLSLNGGPTTPMICFSDSNFIQANETWNVQGYNINQIGSITGAFAGTTTQYNELGYLANELFANPGDGNLQNAIWYVLGTGGANNADYLNAVNYVTSHPGFQTTDEFYIPTGPNLPEVDGRTPQPFIAQGVPEPSSFLLLGGGLLGLLALSFKRAAA